MPPVSDLI